MIGRRTEPFVEADIDPEYDRQVEELFQTVSSAEPTASMLRRFGSMPSSEPPDVAVSLMLVPGAFRREYPRHDAAGVRLLDAAARLGIAAETIDVPSFCGVAYSAQKIEERLRSLRGDPTVLVSLSKGGADVAAWAAKYSTVSTRRKVRAWVSFSGILTGSPLVNWLDRQFLRKLAIRAFFAVRGYRYSDLLELRWDPSAPLDWTDAVSSIPSFHFIGFPRLGDLSSPLARRAVRRISPLGLSDGGGILLHDTLRFPGVVLPLFGHDHYFSALPIDEVLCRALHLVVGEAGECGDGRGRDDAQPFGT